MGNYTPISCALHSEYELMAMHRQRVEIQLSESTEKLVGRVVDISTRNGVEYMDLLADDGQRKELRLDNIKSLSPI